MAWLGDLEAQYNASISADGGQHVTWTVVDSVSDVRPLLPTYDVVGTDEYPIEPDPFLRTVNNDLVPAWAADGVGQVVAMGGAVVSNDAHHYISFTVFQWRNTNEI